MAKRKKLNKRVVILLVAFGVVLGAGIVVLGLSMLPKDPLASARAGQKAFEAGKEACDTGKYELADTRFRKATQKFAEAAEADKADPQYPFNVAEVNWEWRNVRSITQTARNERIIQAHNWLMKALQRKPDHVPSLKLLCEVRWEGGFGAIRFIEAADKLLEIEKSEAQTYYHRALAKMALATDSKYIEEAYEDFKKATELKPEEITYWSGLISFLRRYKPDMAEKAYIEAIKRNPEVASMHVAYGQFLLMKYGDFKRRQQQGMTRPGEEAQAEEWKKLAKQHFETAKEVEVDNTAGAVAMANFYLVEGDLESARKELDLAVTKDEGAYQVYRLQTFLYERMGEREKMLEAMRKALQTMPSLPSGTSVSEYERQQRQGLIDDKKVLCYNLANILMGQAARASGEEKQKLLDEAQKWVSEIESVSPNAAEIVLISARRAIAENKAQEAINILEQARREGNTDRRIVDLLARLYFDSHPGKAQELLKFFPDSPTAVLLRTLLEIRYGQYDTAVASIKEIRNSKPEDIADIKDEVDQVSLALDFLMGKVNRLPAELKLTGRSANTIRGALFEQVQRLWADDRREETVTLLEDLHKKLPNSKEVIVRLVGAYRQLNQTSKVDDLLKRIEATHKNEADWLELVDVLGTVDSEQRFAKQLQRAKAIQDPLQRAKTMAVLCLRYNKEDKFREYVQEAAKINPDDPDVIKWRFEVALAQDPPDMKAAEELAKVIEEKNLDNVGGRFVQVRLLLAKKQTNEAIALLKKILQDRPTNKRERVLLGSIYLTIGNLVEAEEAFRTVAEDDPTSAPAIISLAAIMEVTGREREFEEWVEKAAQLAPHDPRVASWQMVMAERRARDDQLEPFIVRREQKFVEEQGNLPNILSLARLCERAKRYSRAKELYRSYFAKSSNKLSAASLLGQFYVSRENYSDVDALMQGLLANAKDNASKCYTYVVYGELLASYSEQQALNALDEAIKVDPGNEAGYIAKSRFLANQGKLREAVDVMTQLMERQADDAGTRKRLARLCIELKDLDAATGELEKVLQANAEDREALLLMGAICMERFDRPGAVDFYTRALKVAPNFLEARRQRAIAYYLLRKDELAKKELMEAQGVATDRSQLMLLASTWQDIGESEEAKKVYFSLLGRDPNFEPALRGLIRAYSRDKQWSAAGAYIAKGMKMFPDEIYYLVAKAEVHKQLAEGGEELATLAAAFRKKPDLPQILMNYMDGLVRARRFDDALTVSKDYVGKEGYEVWLPAMRARALAKLGKEAEADALFVSALKAADENQLRMVIYDIRDAYGDKLAIEKLVKWTEHRAKDPWFFLQLGALHTFLKDSPSAIGDFEKVVSLTDRADLKAEALANLGTIYQGSDDDSAKAERFYLEALKYNPNHSMAVNNLAYFYADSLKQPAKALPYAEKAEHIAPRNALVLDTYGWTLAMLGKDELAEEVLQDAARLTRGHALIHYHLGQMYEKSKRLDDAFKQYRRARELVSAGEPLYQEISDALRRVQSNMESGRSG